MVDDSTSLPQHQHLRPTFLYVFAAFRLLFANVTGGSRRVCRHDTHSSMIDCVFFLGVACICNGAGRRRSSVSWPVNDIPPDLPRSQALSDEAPSCHNGPRYLYDIITRPRHGLMGSWLSIDRLPTALLIRWRFALWVSGMGGVHQRLQALRETFNKSGMACTFFITTSAFQTKIQAASA